MDGYIAGPSGSGFDQLFAWTNRGDVETASASARVAYRTSQASADHVRHMLDTTGAIVVGRRLFDMTQGWDGTHPMGIPTFVVTHRPPDNWQPAGTPFTFVTGGLPAAVEQAVQAAGEKDVGVGPGSVAWQALDAGLVDELRIDLVPIVLGDGTLMFDQLTNLPILFGDPRIVEGNRVTHLTYKMVDRR